MVVFFASAEVVIVFLGMGTQVQGKSYFPSYFSMRDLNEDSNSSSWPLFYGERTVTNGQYYNGYTPRTIADAYPGYDKDQLKQKMLEHEAVFRNQVYELHRLYRIQRDMMEEIKRTELNKRQLSIEPSSSSSFLGSQKPSEDAGKWHASGFLLANSGYARASVSGAEIVNSPLSCTKENNMPADRGNACMSKDCEVLETRPSKVRKKLFDLQLPADEYIDTEEGEQLHDSKIAEKSSPLPNGNLKTPPGRFDSCFPNGENVTGQINASTSDSYLRSRMRLADLNEPVQVDDAPVPLSVDFLGYSANHGESKGINISSGSNSDIIGSRKEETLKAHPLDQAGSSGVGSVANKGSERDWLSGIHGSGEGLHSLSGQRKNNLIPPPPGFQQDKLVVPPQPTEIRVNKTHQPMGIFPTDYVREETWRGRTDHGFENMDRVFGNSNGNHLESCLNSQVPSLYSYGNSSEVTNSWSHSALSWGKPTSSFSQKLSSFQAHPSLQPSSLLSRSSNSSAQSHGILADKMADNENSRLNRGIGTDLPPMNGFYHGSSSASKEIMGQYPSVGLINLNCKESFNMASTPYLNRGTGESSKSCVKPAKDMDLNVVQSKCPSDEVVALQDVEDTNEKSNAEDHLKVLPWLRPKPSCKSETVNVRESNSGLFQASPRKSFWQGEPVKDLNKVFVSDFEVGLKKENGEIHGVKKILGVSIYEEPTVVQPCKLPGEKAATEVKTKLIDINLACDEQIASEALAVEEATDTKVAHFRNYIDLNSCITEDEESIIPSVASTNSVVKHVVEIDLEAPVPETEDDVLTGDGDKLHEASLKSAESEVEQINEEVVKGAAEAIVSISKSVQLINIEENTCEPLEDPLKECILWFANVACPDDKHETNGGKGLWGIDSLVVGNCSSDEIDEFEVMTLQLQETKEEDYMPKPFVPEVPKVDEVGANAITNRSRKGQTRRGRQRRDFQRDILPGLASLSRHEVTEDLQTFGGLMRATGQSWDAGLTRRNGTRNGRARGRRRAVVVDTAVAADPTPASTPLIQQLNIEASLEDRSLTGWGKTTRRPRRQRCPAGNPTPAALLT
ncbi:OLC1v1032677C2 [Oldenlandia corymbosa var. corymbosa]|uniref:OLC1v1032677C2 n=1 Tax=Oldenlandia corymbosa var. corymbosa TaxID=529605 RepID=A0AAV1CPJ6_OLDCO|nr:OLC1v1032677C2 [Oldenlandia corymbosa var. corymbosa]